MSQNGRVEGGCLCGAVRYNGAELLSSAYCHCRMCQKAVGGPFWIGSQFSRDSFQITRGEPRWYRSSDWIRWGFCRECGSSLIYRADSEGLGNVIPVLCSHDDPRLPPDSAVTEASPPALAGETPNPAPARCCSCAQSV